MSCSEEFQTVSLIVDSAAETRGVDAFALSLIKTERQIRRLVTHLVYQFPFFGANDVVILRETLAKNGQVYFDGFERGFDALYIRGLRDLVGADYDRLRPRINEAIGYRNKIFHGQITLDSLTRDELLSYVFDISAWCEDLAQGALGEFQYDGFIRNSFQKSNVPELWKRFKLPFVDINSYEDFIRRYMERH